MGEDDVREEIKPGGMFALASPLLLLFWFLYLVLSPAYSDYRARAETSEWLAILSWTVREAMSGEIQRNSSLRGAGAGVDVSALKKTKYIRHVEIFVEGETLLQGGRDGQTLIFYPELNDGEVSWHCLGGSKKAMPSQCQ